MSDQNDNPRNDAAMTDEPSGRASASFEDAIHPLEWTGKKPRASVMGTFAPVADQSNWRKKLLDNRIKFDDRAKAIYLAQLEQHGRRGLAARAAGVTPETVQNHIRNNDPDFAAACEEAFQVYRDRIASKLVEEAVSGVLVTKTRQVTGDDGETMEVEIHREVKLETPMRMRILAACAPEFREHSQVDVGSGPQGGVLLVPLIGSFDDWRALFAPADDDSQDKHDREDAPAVLDQS